MGNRFALLALMVIASLCLVFTVACCSPCEQTEENKAVVKAVAAALNAYDYDALDALIAQDYKRHCQATPETTVETLDDFKELMRGWQVSMPDATMSLELMIAEGDMVAVWGNFTATHTGPMGEIPATGKSIAVDFGGAHRLVDGKIVETWVTWDNATMLHQLGLNPTKPEDSEMPPAETP